MRVSIVIPVRNEAQFIRRTLNSLIAQNFPRDQFEILVVDGQSEDRTRDLVRELQMRTPNLHLLDNPRRLASAARNIGVRHASGDFIAIVDGHCHVDDNEFVTKLVDAFTTSGADTLGRPQPLRGEQPTRLQKAVAAARSSWLGHNPDSAIYSTVARFVPPDNVAVAYRREVFDAVGLFDESFDACEDVEFNTRVRLAGFNCYFTPAIAVDYQPRATLGGLARQMARYGVGRARLARKHVATLTLASLIPALWLVWLTLAAATSLVYWPAALLLAVSCSVYASVIMLESLRLRRKDAQVSGRLPFVFLAIHAGYGWGYLREITAATLAWPGLRLNAATRRSLTAGRNR